MNIMSLMRTPARRRSIFTSDMMSHQLAIHSWRRRHRYFQASSTPSARLDSTQEELPVMKVTQLRHLYDSRWRWILFWWTSLRLAWKTLKSSRQLPCGVHGRGAYLPASCCSRRAEALFRGTAAAKTLLRDDSYFRKWFCQKRDERSKPVIIWKASDGVVIKTWNLFLGAHEVYLTRCRPSSLQLAWKVDTIGPLLVGLCFLSY